MDKKSTALDIIGDCTIGNPEETQCAGSLANQQLTGKQWIVAVFIDDLHDPGACFFGDIGITVDDPTDGTAGDTSQIRYINTVQLLCHPVRPLCLKIATLDWLVCGKAVLPWSLPSIVS
jgi:hypothetical protein